MPKFDLANYDPTDTHSVNISVYKPDGILSFWNWFTRKNKNSSQHKNIQFKITKEDLERMKVTGIDFQKLRGLDLSNKSKASGRCNVFAVPRADLDPFLKTLHPSVTAKTYVKRLISKSTISVRSKDSCSDIKVVRTVKSHRFVGSSKGSLRTSVVSNTNVHFRSQPQPKSVFLKSVPTTVLKNNTKKLLVLTKTKSPRGQQATKTNAPGNTTNRATPRDSVIPTLLTRMKSMEEHLSEIGNTTKKINDAVSQRNFTSNNNQPSDSRQPEQNKLKAAKCIAAHKIYSKNIHSPKKNKKRRQKKSQVKSKTNIQPEKAHKVEQKNKGFAFNYFSDSSNDMKHMNELKQTVNSLSKSGLLLNQNMFSLPNNIKYINLTPENSKDTSCDFIMSVVKALTETKGCTDFYQTDVSTAQNGLQGQKTGSEVNVENGKFLSKPTFDWKHSSVSNITESRTAVQAEGLDETTVRQNTTVLLGKPDHNQDETRERQGINPLSDTAIHKQLVFEQLKNKNSEMKVQTHKEIEKEFVKDQKHPYPVEILDKQQSQIEVTQDKTKNTFCNIEAKNDKTENEDQSCWNINLTKHSGFGDVKEDYVGNGMINLKDRQSRLSISRPNEERYGRREERQVEKCEDLQGEKEEYEESVMLRSGVLCNVNVRQSEVSSPHCQLSRITDACSEEKKEPKVSITILVQDCMKDKVKMKSSLVTNSRSSKDEYLNESIQQECSSPLTNFGPKGDQMPTLVSNKTKSLPASENLSSVSCAVSDKELTEPFIKPKDDIYNSKKNKNFYVEVPHEKVEEYLNLGAPGSYLNQEKRKLLDEKVSSSKHKKLSIVQAASGPDRISPTRSCSNISNTITTFDQMIEASFITQETSYSKTKFNICKEKKYSSRTSLKPMEIYKRDPFSEESMTSENNFDISTKFTSQQCVMYCRNNNIKNVRREHFSRYRENFVKPPELESVKQPFFIVHNPKINADTSGKNLNSVNRKKINDSTLREEPILEVSEDESDTYNMKNLPTFENTDVSTSQSVKKKSDPNSHDTRNHIEDQVSQKSSPETSKGFEIPAEVKHQAKLTEHGANKDVVENDLTTDESLNNTNSINLISCTSKTILSSMSVQTDWSLVGITVDHFSNSGDKSFSSSCEKRSVANQTDVMMDQIALVGRDLEDKTHGCKSCMKSSQFSELVACNANISRDANLKENFKELLNSKQAIMSNSEHLNEMKIANMLLTIIENQGSTSFELPTETEQGVLRDPVFEQGSIPQFTYETEELSDKIALEKENYKLKPEEVMKTVLERGPHRCTIPCLTTLSDETVRSNLSESNYHNVITYEVSEDYQSVPQVYGINRGIHGYFNTENDQTSSKLSKPVAECRQNKLVLQTVIDSLTHNSKDAEPHSLYFGKASAGDKETTKNRLFAGETVAGVDDPTKATDNTMQQNGNKQKRKPSRS